MRNLKTLRKQNNLKQQDIANILKIKQQTYSAYENDLTEPDINTLIKLADYYNVSIDFLCDHNNNITLTPEQQELLNLFNKLDKNEQQNIIAYLQGLTNQPLTFKKN